MPRFDPYLANCLTVVMKSTNLDIGMRDTGTLIAVNLVLFRSSVQCYAISVFVT